MASRLSQLTVAVLTLAAGATQAHAASLTPSSIIVPEPSTLAVVSLGLVAWGFLNRRNRAN